MPTCTHYHMPQVSMALHVLMHASCPELGCNRLGPTRDNNMAHAIFKVWSSCSTLCYVLTTTRIADTLAQQSERAQFLCSIVLDVARGLVKATAIGTGRLPTRVLGFRIRPSSIWKWRPIQRLCLSALAVKLKRCKVHLLFMCLLQWCDRT